MMFEWVGPIVDFIDNNNPTKLCKFPIRYNFHGPGAISQLWIFYIPRRQEESIGSIGAPSIVPTTKKIKFNGIEIVALFNGI
jgi:hypothetical protein